MSGAYAFFLLGPIQNVHVRGKRKLFAAKANSLCTSQVRCDFPVRGVG